MRLEVVEVDLEEVVQANLEVVVMEETFFIN
jgi:hypothetical protein